jgi:hypothetical protein
MYLEGFVQEARFSSSAARLQYKVRHEGSETASDAVPNIAIYEPDGDTRVSTTSMTWKSASSGTGWLNYDGASASFSADDVVTGGTSGHTGTVASVRDLGSNDGVIKLTSLTGGFQDNENLIVSSTTIGQANGTAHTAVAYYDLDASATSTYTAGEDYYFTVSYDIGSRSFLQYEYFDIVLYPFDDPLVTSELIDDLHPDWLRSHPDGTSGTWDKWIERAHVEIARRIRAAGKRARCIIKRAELQPYELAEAEALIAEALRFDEQERMRWRKKADSLWYSKGEFAYEDDDDADIEADDADQVIQTSLGR